MGVVHKFTNVDGHYRWEGIEVVPYGEGPAGSVTRQILIGEKDGSVNFIIRYFELSPGAASDFHAHDHEHGVVVLRGRGRVRLGDHEEDLSFGDAVYVPPGEIHQFVNTGDELFGFTCTIKAH